MGSCRKHSDCIRGKYCLPGGVCGETGACTGDAQCEAGFGCNLGIGLCVPQSCAASTKGCPPSTHYCDTINRACQPRLALYQPCIEDVTCLPGLLCHRAVCHQSCASNGTCHPPATCITIMSNRRVCLSLVAGAASVSSFAASGGGVQGSDKEGLTDEDNLVMFKRLAFGLACLLLLCFLLFLVITLLRARRRRKNLVEHKCSQSDVLATDMESGRAAPAPEAYTCKPMTAEAAGSAPEPGLVSFQPHLMATHFVMPKLRSIREEEEEEESPKTSDQGRGDEEARLAVDSSSPSVQSVRALWEERGRLISPTIPTLHIPSPLQDSDHNDKNHHKTDGEETATGRSKSRSRSRNHSRSRSRNHSRSRSRSRSRESPGQQEMRF